MGIELDSGAILFETGYLGETVGDPAGYILQGTRKHQRPAAGHFRTNHHLSLPLRANHN
jgi:hypothetical protein